MFPLIFIVSLRPDPSVSLHVNHLSLDNEFDNLDYFLLFIFTIYLMQSDF